MLTPPDLVTRLRQSAQMTESKLLDEVIDEIIQLRAAAAAAQKAADRWQARAERAEHELHHYRRLDPPWARWRARPTRPASVRRP